jgi:hypothetical protein
MAFSNRGRHAAQKEENNRKRRYVALFAWFMALVLPAGLGYAGWSTSGTGAGAAKATQATSIIVGAGSASAQLYPGAKGDVQFSVQNPNTYPVKVTGWVTPGVTGTDKGAACGPENFTVDPAAPFTAVDVAPGATVTVTVPNGVTMVAAAGDGCQNAAVTVNATLSAA